MQDKEALNFGSAERNQPSKRMQLLSQLLTPMMTIAAAVYAAHNASDGSVLAQTPQL